MAEYTDAERQQIRNAAFGAVALVSRAEPGMFDMIKESFAASNVLRKAPADLQQMILGGGGGLPKIPKGDQGKVESTVLSDLTTSVKVINERDPSQLNSYRQTVMDACSSAANAAGGGASQHELEEMSKIMAALGMPATGTAEVP